MSAPQGKTLIRGGRLIDPAQSLDGRFDLLLEDGVVAKVEESIEAGDGVEVFEAAGLVVTPGWIDIHVHLREPGQEYKETVETGNCPWWLTASGVLRSSTRVNEASGTEPPVFERRKIPERSCGVWWKPGWVSSTTRYWLSWVNMVEIWRWPKAS
jgi:hypothetical protein